MNLTRGSGILLHITSLPGEHGIGDLGHGAYSFVDYLAEYRQKYWQILPIGPCGSAFDNSPYMSISSFAGNPLFISPDVLIDSGLLSRRDIPRNDGFRSDTVRYEDVIPYKEAILRVAFKTFKGNTRNEAFDKYCFQQAWLDDYALFLALKEENKGKVWNEWPRGGARHDNEHLASCRERLRGEIEYHKFVQYVFHVQWQNLHDYARSRNISIIGDIPIYAAFDSADVWANQDCFKINPKTMSPTHVAGVPPDYFSETGQRWGNPLYRWNAKGTVRKALFMWWRTRLENIFRLVDIIRIDHFRGFESYWEIPDREETAVKGRWVKGPGKKFFQAMRVRGCDMPIIAEDLGLITPEVDALRDACGFPGMKVLQFAFDSDEENAYLPHNYSDSNYVIYTGTHDNDTSAGWYHSANVSEESKERARRYARCNGREIHWDFIRMALASIAKVAIIPLQDLLGCGSDCRMNKPSTCRGNWRWRCESHLISNEIGARLRDETIFYARDIKQKE